MDYVTVLVTHPFLMLWAGQLLHVLKEVKEIETRAPSVTISLYVKRHKYGVMFSTIASLAAYSILHQMGELTPISALMAGYMSESIVNAAASRVTRKVSGDEYGFYGGGESDNYNTDKGDEYYGWFASQSKKPRTRRTRSKVPSDSGDPPS